MIPLVGFPWWGTGVFTLGGGAVVALVPQVFNLYVGQRKASGERAAAEQALRREALLEYLATATRYVATTPENRKETHAAFELARLRLELLINDVAFKEAVLRYWSAMYDLQKAEQDADRTEITTEALEAEVALVTAARASSRMFGLPA